MDQAAAMEKVKKLLSVVKSGSSTEGELLQASALIQRLINKFNIDSILLETKPETIDPLADIPVTEVLFTFEGPRVHSWMLNLLGALGDISGVKTWFRTGGNYKDVKGKLEGAGRTIDLAACRFMLSYLYNEIESLTESASRKHKNLEGSCSKTWSNSFKLGVVSEVSYRIREEHKRNREELLNPNLAYERALACGDTQRIMDLDASPKFEIAVIQNAVATLDDRKKKATEWIEEKLGKFTHGVKRVGAKNYGAYSAGIDAGKQVNLSNQNKQLT